MGFITDYGYSINEYGGYTCFTTITNANYLVEGQSYQNKQTSQTDPKDKKKTIQLKDFTEFTFNDMGISTCLDATTGKLLWTERLPDQFTASPIEAGGFIYVSGESGKTYVLKVSDKFELVATNDLGSPILASPAIVNGNLLLRTRDALYCIGTK
jgi:outer membrane protein assembly factor BamB